MRRFPPLGDGAATPQVQMNDYDPEPPRMSPTAIVGVISAGLFIVAGVVLLVALIRHRQAEPPVANARPQQTQQRALAIPHGGPRSEPAPRAAITDEDLERANRQAKLVIEIVIAGICLALWILMMAWVARDCRNRGIDGGAVWVLIVFVLGAIGLAIYMAARPHGFLVECPHCFNRRLGYAAVCPHCHRTTDRA